MAKKVNVTLKKSEGKKHLQPYCEKAAMAAIFKSQADELRAQASDELKAKLDSNPETKDYTGTVVYLCDDQVYRIRVQRPINTNWRKKKFDDPLLDEYKQRMKDLDELKARTKELEEDLAKKHPKCIEKGFVIGLLSK